MKKPFTKEKFKDLALDDKANILWQNGTYLIEIIDYNSYRVCVYELHKFHVGVFYNVKNNRIDKIEVLGKWKFEFLKNYSMN